MKIVTTRRISRPCESGNRKDCRSQWPAEQIRDDRTTWLQTTPGEGLLAATMGWGIGSLFGAKEAGAIKGLAVYALSRIARAVATRTGFAEESTPAVLMNTALGSGFGAIVAGIPGALVGGGLFLLRDLMCGTS